MTHLSERDGTPGESAHWANTLFECFHFQPDHAKEFPQRQMYRFMFTIE